MRSSHFQRDSPANKSDPTLVRLVYPGHRTKIASRTATCLLLILLTILGFNGALPTKPIDASSADTTSDNGASRQGMVSSLQMPQRVGASPLPDLSLPHTVVSSLKQPVNEGGAMRVSPDNIIIYNAGVTMRLRGGLAPHDELLSSDESVLSSWMFWRVEVSIGGSWVQLNPSSSNFTIFGTNSTGTFVVRTMSVGLGQYSCTLRIWYEALSTGLLKWDLELVASTTGQYRLFYDWHDIGEKAELSRSVERLRVGYRGIDYTLSWDDVSSSFNSTATLVAGRFSLEVDLGALASG